MIKHDVSWVTNELVAGINDLIQVQVNIEHGLSREDRLSEKSIRNFRKIPKRSREPGTLGKKKFTTYQIEILRCMYDAAVAVDTRTAGINWPEESLNLECEPPTINVDVSADCEGAFKVALFSLMFRSICSQRNLKTPSNLREELKPWINQLSTSQHWEVSQNLKAFSSQHESWKRKCLKMTQYGDKSPEDSQLLYEEVVRKMFQEWLRILDQKGMSTSHTLTNKLLGFARTFEEIVAAHPMYIRDPRELFFRRCPPKLTKDMAIEMYLTFPRKDVKKYIEDILGTFPDIPSQGKITLTDTLKGGVSLK